MGPEKEDINSLLWSLTWNIKRAVSKRKMTLDYI